MTTAADATAANKLPHYDQHGAAAAAALAEAAARAK